MLKIGNKTIKLCNSCPAYKWRGENVEIGDCGMYCDFGSFHTSYEEHKEIPANCCLSKYKIDEELPVEPTCDSCI